MQPLEKTLRNQLERTVKAARDVAETATNAALVQLTVSEKNPGLHLSESHRDLRRQLRIHGRQLGDLRSQDTEVQEISRLIEEIAYEHWHRMLFARFLAENNLLMFDGVAVTLEECSELANDTGSVNGWELAAKLASNMLPQIFRPNSPSFELHFPPEHQQKLERLVADLPKEVFMASDSLGWVYQFWQAKRKEEVNKSEVKIGARELPAVTQLFTEPYMVSFLLDNALGAWWAASRLSESDLKNTKSEEELRAKASLPGVPLEYLRFVKKEDGSWTPAAGTFDSWPKQLSELKVLDPCCGSGHFLVAAFLMLVPMRMELEKLTAREACDAVLRENIHGLEIDQRCVELAAFALALTTWRYPNSGGYRSLPELHVACSGLSLSVAKEEWKQLALDKHNLRIAMDWMYDMFKDASVLGSLLDPAKSDASKLVKWEELLSALEQALKQEQTDEQKEVTVVAQGLAKAATMMTGKYNLVITNVPYLSRGKQSKILRDFSEKYFPEAKNDLATVFLFRCIDLCLQGGYSSIILPQNWLFLTGYKLFRKKLLKNDYVHLIAKLGYGGFQTPLNAAPILIVLSKGNGDCSHGELFRQSDHINKIRGVEVSEFSNVFEKAAALKVSDIKVVNQIDQLSNPDSRIGFSIQEEGVHLNFFAECYQGIVTGDIERFTKKAWEIISSNNNWLAFRRSCNSEKKYGDVSDVILWEEGRGQLHLYAKESREQLHDMHESGNLAWGKKGVAINRMGALKAVSYYGEHFDNNVAVVFPKNKKQINSALQSFFESNEFATAIRELDQALKVTNRTLLKVPFNIEYWNSVAAEQYPHGLPKPFSDDSTQWIFHGHPCGSVIWDEQTKWTKRGKASIDNTVLQIAVARLLGYRWPAELDPDMELADEQRELVKRCQALNTFSDDDGIVCIPPVRGEAGCADRLLNLLATAYGDEWTSDTLSQLLSAVDHAGKSLESWLREKFFTQHCKLFHHRPFIWHIWDGLRDGFSVLVNYHKLDHKTLETLIYTYLGDWISRQKDDIKNGVDGAADKLAAAEQLKKRLELILEGEAPYDIFVRWKTLHKQPLGWNPDLNDGVRMNIRPFLSVADVAKKGAGILRDKPNIKWDKDRGQDVQSAPWYSLGLQYGGKVGDRINDHHLSLEEKKKAKENKHD